MDIRMLRLKYAVQVGKRGNVARYLKSNNLCCTHRSCFYKDKNGI